MMFIAAVMSFFCQVEGSNYLHIGGFGAKNGPHCFQDCLIDLDTAHLITTTKRIVRCQEIVGILCIPRATISARPFETSPL